jgi:hypothetical protein
MADVGTLRINLIVNMAKFTSQMQAAAAQVKKFSERVVSGMKKATRAVVDFALRSGRALAAFATKWLKRAGLAIGAFLAWSVKLSAAAEESENLVRESFGNMTDSVVEWSETLQRQLGLNAIELRRQAGFLQLMINSYGLAADEATEMATTLTELAADMASFRNQRFEDMFEKIRSGIAGMSRPLKELGINLQDDAIDMLLLEQGIDKTSQTLTQQQKILARYALLLKATTKDQGDLARTYDTTTNAARVLLSQVKILATELGDVLLPHINAVAVAMRDWLIENREDIVAWFNDAVDKFMRFVDFLRSDFRQGFQGSLEIIRLVVEALVKAILAVFEDAFTNIGKNIAPWILKGVKQNLAQVRKIGSFVAEHIKGGIRGVFGFRDPRVFTIEFGEELSNVDKIFLKLKDDISAVTRETMEWADTIKVSEEDIAEAAEKRQIAFDDLQNKLEQSRKENAAKAQEAIEQLRQTVDAQKMAAEEIKASWSDVGETITEVMTFANDSVKGAFADMLVGMATEMDNFGDFAKRFVVDLMQIIARMQAELVAAKILGSTATGGLGGGNIISNVLGFLGGGLGKVQAKARGGIAKPVYAAQGFVAKGSDTVPAMLTPGEGVLNKDLTEALREQLGVPGGMGGGQVTINVQTIDTQTTAQWLQNNRRLIAGTLQETVRANNPLSRRGGRSIQ